MLDTEDTQVKKEGNSCSFVKLTVWLGRQINNMTGQIEVTIGTHGRSIKTNIRWRDKKGEMMGKTSQRKRHLSHP